MSARRGGTASRGASTHRGGAPPRRRFHTSLGNRGRRRRPRAEPPRRRSWRGPGATARRRLRRKARATRTPRIAAACRANVGARVRDGRRNDSPRLLGARAAAAAILPAGGRSSWRQHAVVTGRSPQWFVADADRGGELYVVFRGTKGTADLFRDSEGKPRAARCRRQVPLGLPVGRPRRRRAPRGAAPPPARRRGLVRVRPLAGRRARDDAALRRHLLPPTFTTARAPPSRSARPPSRTARSRGGAAPSWWCRTPTPCRGSSARRWTSRAGSSRRALSESGLAATSSRACRSTATRRSSRWSTSPAATRTWCPRRSRRRCSTCTRRSVRRRWSGVVCWRVESGPRPGRLRGGDRLGAKNRTAVPGIPVVPGVPVG